MIIFLMSSLAHWNLTIISEYDDNYLLEAIDKLKVCKSNFNQPSLKFV